MDRLTSLAVFIATVEEGSLAAAARRFDLSPAMAGKHVSSLESALNARLLQRTTRRLNLTEVGQTYYKRCKRILDELDDANREASDVQSSPRGLLKIAAPVTFSEMHLGVTVGKYLDAHPSVNIEVILNDQYIDLVDEGVDLAIRIGELHDSDLIARRLAPCRMVVCASPTYIAGHGLAQSPADIAAQSRLAFKGAVSAGDWTFSDSEGNTHTIDGPVRMLANNMQMLLSAALSGAGIAYGPTFVFGPYLERDELIELLPDFRTTELAIHAVYPTSRHVSLKSRRFVDFLARDFGAQPPWDRWRFKQTRSLLSTSKG